MMCVCVCVYIVAFAEFNNVYGCISQKEEEQHSDNVRYMLWQLELQILHTGTGTYLLQDMISWCILFNLVNPPTQRYHTITTYYMLIDSLPFKASSGLPSCINRKPITSPSLNVLGTGCCDEDSAAPDAAEARVDGILRLCCKLNALVHAITSSTKRMDNEFMVYSECRDRDLT